MEGPKLPEEYDKPNIEDCFENLYAAETTNGPVYSLWQRQPYDNISSSAHVNPWEAMNVARLLNRGEVEEAEQAVNKLLELEQ